MKINSLVCRNFKVFDNQQFTFGSTVTIQGENFNGKTSIGEAICVAFYGCTLTGSPQVDHLIRTGAKKFEISVEFEMNGEKHEIVRSRNRKTDIYLDDKNATQADIDLKKKS